jgi:GNAT superfamily N-acetyltransferase
MIRSYRDSDWEVLRDICVESALYGQPIAPLVDDRELVAEALLGYYARFERESLFVAEVEGRVVGYLTGCVDTKKYERIFTSRGIPRLLLRLITRGHFYRPMMWRLLAALVRTGLRRHRTIHTIMGAYPAHCHIDIAAAYQRVGLGSKLLDAFLCDIKSRGVRGIHVSTLTGPGKAFFVRMGFTLLGSYPAIPIGDISPGEVLIMGKSL